MSRILNSRREGLSPSPAGVHARPHLLVAGLLVGLLLAPGNALALDPGKSLLQFPHRVWQTTDGLPQNTILALVQTPDGYLWAGTFEGLVRFDGVRFTVFDPWNTPALPDRSIIALSVDRDGTLWISTNSGLVGMRDGRFFPVPLPDSIVARDVSRLLSSHDGSLWIATLGSGLARMYRGQLQIWKTAQGLASDRVQALAEDEAGTLWVASSGGLQRWDGSAFVLGPSFQGPPPQVETLVTDARGVLWAGDVQGTVYRSQDGVMLPVPEASLPGDPLSALLFDHQGVLWVASRGQGLLRLADGRRSVLNPRNELDRGTSYSIFSLLEDAEGSLWLGMGAHGLHRLKDAPFTPYGVTEGLGHDVVSSVREARDGSLWFATLGGGISRRKDGRMETWTTREGLLDDRVFGSAEGRDGSLWFATSRGVIHWQGGMFTSLPASGPVPRIPLGRTLYEDEAGTLWVGTVEGLARWDGKQFALVARQDKVLGAHVRVLERRAAGGFWVGTQGGGLGWYAEGRFSVLASPGTPMDGDVRSLYEDGETLWVGTTKGLFRWKDGHSVRLSRAQGLFDDVVLTILPDGRGNLWMSCNRGIFRVSQKEIEAVADGKLARVTSRHYDEADGMRSKECSALGGPAGIRARDGTLWFPTIGGAVAYEPGREEAPAALPPVHIEQLRVDGHPLAASEWSRIPPGEGDVEVHYTSPALSSAEQVRFRYKLEGVDADWVEAGNRRVAYYTLLPPGRYRFQVEVFSIEAGVPARGAELEFSLEPRFFQTALFRVGCALAVVLAVAGGVWLRLRQSRERERQLQAIVDERTAQLASRLKELQETRGLLVQAERLAAVGTLAAGVGHELNLPLGSILSSLRYLSMEMHEVTRLQEELARWRGMEEALADAFDGAEKMRKIVQDLKTFARDRPEPSGLGPVDIHAVLDVALRITATELRAHARLVKEYGVPQSVQGDETRLGQVFVNLLVNAAQAIPAGEPEHHEIRVTTRHMDGRAVIEVSDTGRGIAPEILPRIFEPFFTTKQATGMGLAICYSTIQALGGEIQVRSTPGQGSTFRILLPATVTVPEGSSEAAVAASSPPPPPASEDRFKSGGA